MLSSLGSALMGKHPSERRAGPRRVGLAKCANEGQEVKQQGAWLVIGQWAALQSICLLQEVNSSIYFW